MSNKNFENWKMRKIFMEKYFWIGHFLNKKLQETRLPITRMRNRNQYRIKWIIFSETYVCKI